MKRVGVTAVGVTAGVGLLSACSPAQLPLAAAWLDTDGRPVALVRPCGHDRAGSIHLSSWTADETADGASGTPEGQGSDTGWGTPLVGPHGEPFGTTTFPLFEPPRSWRTEAVGPQALAPGRTYYLKFTVPGGAVVHYSGVLDFTAKDLTSLHSGQVWADGRAMSRDDFDDLVDDKC
ncbi:MULTISPECIES: hypothetical protein [unclassified Streptomyces]|uniref:hypothetical protein n=1 Tax=unclassified Streptomyces TaxID=2593676 RepID=UPI00190C5DF1|nr:MULTISPECIES: hypothetical protein [unclassified Streptomyces]MBK3566632.1 hypothetical protein [Streptomyces sp. MBT62]MBK6017701.1 hypothetical protein [Streptomyces sp. MBT53]